MVTAVTKKVRLTAASARKLRRLAREDKRTESDVLREGIDFYEQMRDRQRAVKELIAMIDGPEPPKIRWSLKP